MTKTNSLKYMQLLVLCALVTFTNCKNNDSKDVKNITDNVLLLEWTGPFNGVPAFDKMKVEDIKEAMQKGMKLSLADIDNIATNSEPATFENTIAAMERYGKELDRVYSYYDKFK